jgi:soluble lytic murein transglycosylase
VLSYAIIYQQLILGNCSMHDSTSATAPCVALPPASMQSSGIPAVEKKGLKMKELMLDVLPG